MSAETSETAKVYNSAVDVMYNMLNTDCDYAISYVGAVDDAFINRVASLFGEDTAAEVVKSIENLQGTYSVAYDGVMSGWVYHLELDYPEQYAYYSSLLEEYELSKVYEVACPVDVYVYDMNGDIAASVVDGVPYCRDGANITVAADGDKKILYLYSDEYDIVYVGNDEGSMDISVTEYDGGVETRNVYFNGITLSDGLTYTSTESGENGVEDDYVISGAGEDILPGYDSLAASDETYTAAVEQGYFVSTASVSAELHEGEKAEITAYVPDGYKFVGWTSDAREDIFEDVESISTYVTMPGYSVTLSAVIAAPSLGITSAENGVIEVQALNCEDLTGTIYISVYDADGIHKATVTAAISESVSISELEFESGDLIKAFLWDENMQPQVAFAQRLAS